MNWDSIQQVLRIILYAIGGYFLGESVTEGELFQAAVGGVLAAGSFVWWMVWERNRPGSIRSVSGGLFFIVALVLGAQSYPGALPALLLLLLAISSLWLVAAWRARGRA